MDHVDRSSRQKSTVAKRHWKNGSFGIPIVGNKKTGCAQTFKNISESLFKFVDGTEM